MATKKSKVTGDSDKKLASDKIEQTPEEKLLEEQKQRLVKCKALYAAAAAGRRRYDWEWVVRNLYLRGYHFARYNRANSTYVLGTRTKVRIPINIMWAQARAIRNQVTAFRPKWEVLPDKPTEAAVENAQWSGKLLDYLFKKLHLKRKLKEIIYQGLYTSIGAWQITWDTAKKEVSIEVVDPFDLYIDPNASSYEDAQYVIKCVRKPLQYIKTHPIYGKSATDQDIKPDKSLASSEYKEFLMRSVATSGEGQSTLEEDNEYAILREAQLKEYQEDGSLKVRFMAWTDDCIYPLRDDLTDEEDANYEIFQADIQPLEIYGESWAKHLMPINRVLDALESSIFEYNHFFAKGRFVIDKGAGVRSIINEHGQIIEKNPGFTVTSLPLAPLPPTHLAQIQNMRQYMEDIGGLHEVSMGRIPVGVKSGVGIAELKQADASSQDDLVDAMEDFLVRTADKIFKIISQKYTSTKLAEVASPSGKSEYFYVVGEKSQVGKESLKKKERKFGDLGLPIAIIGSENQINVTVGSWLAYTKQARQSELKELYRLGAIDQQTLLQHLEFGDIASIVERSRAERLVQIRQSMRPNMEAAAQRGVDDESLALAENELMDKGTPEPVDVSDDHEVHLVIHKPGLEKTKYPELYADHISQHIRLMQIAPAGPTGMGAMMAGAGEAEAPAPAGPQEIGPAAGGGGMIPTPPLTGGQ